MDIAALILAPLLLALVYSWSGIGKLPRLVLVGLPVGLLAVLFVALLGYGPAVHEAVVTKTPLIRTIDGGSFLAFHLDGVSLMFALLIIGVGVSAALYGGADLEEDVYRRFVRGVLALVGVMLGLVLIDHPIAFFAVWMLMITASFLSMREKGRKRAWIGFALASLGAIALLIGVLVLPQAGAQVKTSQEPVYAISQISASNLSRQELYNTYFISILIGVLSVGLQGFFAGRTDESKDDPWVAPTLVMLGAVYLLARLYPALHDNLLWWNGVTGVGLLIMLIGAVWALRQRETKAILIASALSGFGACVALLGLPEFLGYKVALIGVVVQALSGAALFLSLDISRKRARWGIVGLALLPLAIFHVLMIGAFAQVTLNWAGIALAVVMVSTALWVVGMARILFGRASGEMGETIAGRPTESPLQMIVPGVLSLASLGCIELFDVIFGPLLNSMLMPKGVAADIATPVILGVLAIVGGVILYAPLGNKPHLPYS
jgi:formate hydrogenlyase subunit 3/multisubunit Na+/H+ antiporter MnhD subunit